jgi:hypothetical protein
MVLHLPHVAELVGDEASSARKARERRRIVQWSA